MNELKSFYELKNGHELKKMLKERFGHNFKVKRSTGTASHYIHVKWVDGPSSSEVEKYLALFSDNKNDDQATDLFCGSQYISPTRDYSSEFEMAIISYLQVRYGFPLSFGDYGLEAGGGCDPKMSDYIRHEFYRICSIASEVA